jgi:predicted nucleic acid-binding Zn ribbon protein
MTKYCEICGKPIKTGKKYCYEHRNTRERAGNRNIDILLIGLIIVSIFLTVMSFDYPAIKFFLLPIGVILLIFCLYVLFLRWLYKKYGKILAWRLWLVHFGVIFGTLFFLSGFIKYGVISIIILIIGIYLVIRRIMIK